MNVVDFYDESNAKTKTRNKIIDAAIELLIQHDFDQVSMVHIANYLDITQRNLYRYYANKDFLIMDAVCKFLYEHQYQHFPKECMQTEKGIVLLQEVLAHHFSIPTDTHRIQLDHLRFLSKFDFYLNTLQNDNPALERYRRLYMADYNEYIRDDIREAITVGLQDGSIILDSTYIDITVESIFQSLASLMGRIIIKKKERELYSHKLLERSIELFIVSLAAHA